MGKTKSRATTYLFFGILLILVAADKPKLTKTKLTGEITALIPTDWLAMNELDFTQRYPSVRAPLAAYTNQERTVDFSVNISATQWPDADLKLSQQFFKASLLNMFDRVDIIDEGIKEINKKKYIAFEFESRINGNRKDETQKDPMLKYTYIQYLIEPDRTLVFSFNCPRRLKDEWQETAREMMKSIVVKKAPAKKK